MKANKNQLEIVPYSPNWPSAFDPETVRACLGQVSEIFDGDAPHTPRGCVAQAWSVSELLRATVEDVYEKKELSTVAASAKGV